MKKLTSILCAILIIGSCSSQLCFAATNSAIHNQYDTGNVSVDAGPIAVRAAYKSNSYATLDGYVYCCKIMGGNERSIGVHSYSLTGNRTSSLYSTLSKFWMYEETEPSTSIRKTCPSMSSSVQAVRYSTGASVSTTYSSTVNNSFCNHHNPSWSRTVSYTLTVYSTLHNYYSSSNDFFMYPTVVNY